MDLLTGSCVVLGLGGRAVDPASSLAAVPSLEVFLMPSILACWALAAWVFTDWRSWKHKHSQCQLTRSGPTMKYRHYCQLQYLCDGAHSFGASLPEDQFLVTVQVLGGLDEAEVD